MPDFCVVEVHNRRCKQGRAIGRGGMDLKESGGDGLFLAAAAAALSRRRTSRASGEEPSKRLPLMDRAFITSSVLKCGFTTRAGLSIMPLNGALIC